jgi:dCTP diphosphatase
VRGKWALGSSHDPSFGKVHWEFVRERERKQYHSLKNLAIGLSIEARELLEIFTWLTQEESSNLSAEKIQRVKEEVGDVMIYLLNFCDKLGLDPLQCAREKLVHNAKKYPADKVRGSARKHNEYA